MQKCCFYASIQKQPLIGHYFMFMGLLVSLGPWRQLYLFLVYIWTCFGVSEMGHIYVWMFVFVFTFRLFRINIIMVILKSYIQLYFIWVYLFVFVELGSFCHTCRFIVNLTLNRAMDLSGGAPLLLDTFMLRWSTLIGYLHAGPINYSYIRSIYLYWKHAIPVACRAVLCCSTVVLYCRYSSCCCVSIYFYHGYS